MNKKDLAKLISQGGLTAQQIEDLLTDFINSERAKIRPKYEVIGEAIVEPESLEINPQDMVSGEWYKSKDCIFKFAELIGEKVFSKETCFFNQQAYVNCIGFLCFNFELYDLRKATREEVLKYFPTAFDIDKVTDEQL